LIRHSHQSRWKHDGFSKSSSIPRGGNVHCVREAHLPNGPLTFGSPSAMRVGAIPNRSLGAAGAHSFPLTKRARMYRPRLPPILPTFREGSLCRRRDTAISPGQLAARSRHLAVVTPMGRVSTSRWWRGCSSQNRHLCGDGCSRGGGGILRLTIQTRRVHTAIPHRAFIPQQHIGFRCVPVGTIIRGRLVYSSHPDACTTRR